MYNMDVVDYEAFKADDKVNYKLVGPLGKKNKVRSFVTTSDEND